MLAAYLVLYMLWPQLQQVSASYASLQQNQQKVESAANWEVKLANYKETEEKLEAFISNLFVRLPDEDQMSSIVAFLNWYSKESGVVIRRMRPIERGHFEGYTVLPLVIELEGNHHQVARFLNELEQSSYLVTIRKVNMKAPDELTSRKLATAITLEVTIMNAHRKEGD